MKKKLINIGIVFIYSNASLYNPLSMSWSLQDFSVENGKIDTVASPGTLKGEIIIDLQGKRVIPGLIDSHVHIESSFLRPHEFGRLILLHGVTTAICDSHEIANVAGVSGIDFMLDDAHDSPADLFFMIPSCVPATPLEIGGSVVSSDDIKKYVHHPRVLGLGEMMNVPGVLNNDAEVCAKLALFSHVDGHAPLLSGDALKQYAAHGISTDHECSTPEELLERVDIGMYVLLREGDAAKNVATLAPVVTRENAHLCGFCTDDRHADMIAEEGTIDNCIRVAVSSGMPLEIALRLATLSGAEAMGLKDRGIISPGKIADFCILADTLEFKIETVYKNGVRVTEDSLSPVSARENKITFPPFVIPSIQPADIAYPSGDLKGIQIIEGSLITDMIRVSPNDTGITKLLCIDRYRGKNWGIAPVKGLNLRCGAIAQSIMHDAHYIIAAGTNDTDLIHVVEALAQSSGGMAVSNEGNVDIFPLPIGGLMASESYKTVCKSLKMFFDAVEKTGASTQEYMKLGFLGLTVIPHLKLTPRGLFDCDKFTDVSLIWDKH